jgi:hypothetical protein
VVGDLSRFVVVVGDGATEVVGDGGRCSGRLWTDYRVVVGDLSWLWRSLHDLEPR